MPMAPRYKRKQYIVAAKFQLKYVGLILILVFLTGILCSYVVYYTSMLLLGDKLANVYPQGRLISIVNMVNVRILLSLLLITPLVFIIGIYASHKIAGPIYRIEKFLKAMASGELSEPLTLRKNDELVALAEGINNVAESIKATIRQEREHLAKSAVSVDALRRLAQSKSVDHHTLENTVEKLGDEISKASLELNRYKV
ncbi:MAG: methyl-accepting chemotaxis protein [Candidatus Omnitrophota bacterium]|nr:methyl-accepting chemotaxis protein [Candidatus Omnitrophota bacterium]